jgi:hypothetical protein
MTSYWKFSPEELRLADYLHDRRYGTGTSTPSPLPSNSTPATFVSIPFTYNGTPGRLSVPPSGSTATPEPSTAASVTPIPNLKSDSDVPPAKKRKAQEMDFS